jgi:cytochrome P450
MSNHRAVTEETPSQMADHYGWGTAAFTACPYPFYAHLQREAPVFHVPGTNTFLVSRWADIASVALNAKLFERPPRDYGPQLTVDFPTISRYTPRSTVESNGPEHKLKRAWGLRLVERERLRSYVPLIRGIADELIDSFVDQERCEFRWQFAEKLPAYLMMDLLGLPREDASIFMADEISAEDRKAQKDREHRYVLEAISSRLRHRTDDFLSEILYDQIERDGTVDINFQVAQGTNLILAGSETTAHLLTNTMQIVCRDAQLANRVRADHSLLRRLIEESMRLESPVQWTARTATGDTVVAGVEIPAGATVWLLWGAGNRDSNKWDDPETFVLERPHLAQEQLAFGRGPRLCLGAPLARLESVIAFDRLITRLTKLRVLDQSSDLTNVMKAPPSMREGTFDSSGNMRGPKTLVVAFERA